jgi:hypothetical protein
MPAWDVDNDWWRNYYCATSAMRGQGLMRDDYSEREFATLGIARHDVHDLSRALRRDVARLARLLLPDIEYSAAPGVLLCTRDALAEIVTSVTRNLMSSEMIQLSPRVISTSTLPVITLTPVVFELTRRVGDNIWYMGVASRARPDPDFFLQETRRRYSQSLAVGAIAEPPIPAQFPPLLSGLVRRAITERIQTKESHGRAQEWTGWTLLAVMHALDTHEDKVPIPGRKPGDFENMYARQAYTTGRLLLIGAALDLIGETEFEPR